MAMDVVFHQTPVKLESILDHQYANGLQLSVTELSESQFKDRTSFQVEVIINSEALPGLFHRTFLFKETSSSQPRFVTINVSGKILRQDQGTATLKYGVHMKSIMTKENDDEDRQ